MLPYVGATLSSRGYFVTDFTKERAIESVVFFLAEPENVCADRLNKELEPLPARSFAKSMTKLPRDDKVAPNHITDIIQLKCCDEDDHMDIGHNARTQTKHSLMAFL